METVVLISFLASDKVVSIEKNPEGGGPHPQRPVGDEEGRTE